MAQNFRAQVVAIQPSGVPVGTDPCLLSLASDPTAGGGLAAPLGSVLMRTDTQLLYQKNGAAATAWTLVGGTATLTGQIILNGVISPTILGGNQNNYNPAGLSTASVVRQDISTTVSITGLVAQPANTLLAFKNIKPAGVMEWITFSHESGSSTAANRFNLPSRADWSIPPGGTAVFLYDGAISRWTVFSFATNNFPTADGDGSPGLTVGPPSEHNGLQRVSSQIMGLKGGASNRVRLAANVADPNTFNIQNDTYLQVLGQTRFAGTDAIGPLTGTVNNQAIATTTTNARITTSAITTLTGMTGGAAGRLITLINASANNIVVNSEDAGSTAANRFLLSGAFITILPEAVAQFWYDTTSSRWRAWSAS